MARVITFSRVFPKGHPKAGQPTMFVEKIWKAFVHMPDYRLPDCFHPFILQSHLFTSGKPIDQMMDYFSVEPKHHTIRAGNRWKVGDIFTPRVWGTDINPKSGRSGPYQSKQITFAPDIEIKKVWNVAYHSDIFFMNEKIMSPDAVKTLAKNDGLSLEDFYEWFRIHPKAKKEITEFQIVCWNEAIQY